MHRRVRMAIGLFAALSPIPMFGAQEGSPEASKAHTLTFEHDIRPILRAHCFDCHGSADELKGKLDLRLRRSMVKGGESGPAVVPGKLDESLLYHRVLVGEMPPGDVHLSEKEIATIGRWIEAGAPTVRDEPESVGPGLGITAEERSFWSFQPIVRPPVPLFVDDSRVRTPVDALLAARLREKGLSFSPDADKRTLLRRTYFDLIGLPPTPAEEEQFLADNSSDAYERLVDRLLASPNYGERWGRHWLDVAGYADSEGDTQSDTPRTDAYKYRDYVIRSFNADKPFDRFIHEQLAGDEMVAPPYANLSDESTELLTATGFLRMSVDGTVSGGGDQEALRNQVMADTIKIVSSSLLGLTVGCAQCHDHRYDPISQADYYRMRAVFEPAYNWKNWQVPSQRRVSLYTDVDRAKAAEVDAAAGQLSAERDAKQTAFIDAALEKELLKFDEALRGPIRTAFHTPADKRTDEQKELLAKYPSANINGGNLYQYNPQAADEIKKYGARIGAIQAQKPVEEFIRVLMEFPGNVPDTFVFHRGDHRQPKEKVEPGDLTITSTAERFEIPSKASDLPTSGRRTAYARRLTSGTHPLVTRVLVNRVWMHHFGKGLVDTPADFGSLGQRPTHPELLDWLADEFVKQQWSLKRLHKLIMMSTAYRQSSFRDSAKEQIDPDNILYWRKPVIRLDAEALRDSILATSGAFNRKMFGPPVPVKEDTVGQIVVGIDNKTPENRPGDNIPLNGEEFRRSVFVEVRRSRPLAMLRAFDAPVMETNCDRRPTSTASTQSLMLMNSEFIVEQADQFAQRLVREAGSDVRAQLSHGWRLAFSRSASETELTQSLQFVTAQGEHIKSGQNGSGDQQIPTSDAQQQALRDFCQTLLCANEFLYVD
ncbi:MAG: PSD1 and planctomycete cytochrome C domain-containing protein [Planctomycetaceae bacterium]